MKTLSVERLNGLREQGRMKWKEDAWVWMAEPEDVVAAFITEGFEERRREITRRPDREPTGGVWQGVHRRTGSIASAVWINRLGSDPARVLIDIDGEPIEG